MKQIREKVFLTENLFSGYLHLSFFQQMEQDSIPEPRTNAANVLTTVPLG